MEAWRSWGDLGDRFAGLRASLLGVRLDGQLDGQEGEWRLAGRHEPWAREAFRALAGVGGKYLPSEWVPVADEGNPEKRWYAALANVGRGLRARFVGAERGADGQVVRRTTSGSIDDPVGASIALCRQLEATEVKESHVTLEKREDFRRSLREKSDEELEAMHDQQELLYEWKREMLEEEREAWRRAAKDERDAESLDIGRKSLSVGQKGLLVAIIALLIALWVALSRPSP